ncbi:translation initiation factor IF-2 [Oryctolagus cuniculus]|uniref:translation initiation factor IF-2 n=1 Tax=Oryctolagus cuniculus TaxID=9986 RepID=UPI00387A21BC
MFWPPPPLSSAAAAPPFGTGGEQHRPGPPTADSDPRAAPNPSPPRRRALASLRAPGPLLLSTFQGLGTVQCPARAGKAVAGARREARAGVLAPWAPLPPAYRFFPALSAPPPPAPPPSHPQRGRPTRNSRAPAARVPLASPLPARASVRGLYSSRPTSGVWEASDIEPNRCALPAAVSGRRWSWGRRRTRHTALLLPAAVLSEQEKPGKERKARRGAGVRQGRGGGRGHGEPGPRAHSGESARGLQLGRWPGCSRREGSRAGTPAPGAPRCLGARTSEGPAVCGDLSRVSRGWSGDPGGPACAGRCRTGPGFRSLEMEPASLRVSVRLLGPSGLVAEAGPIPRQRGSWRSSQWIRRQAPALREEEGGATYRVMAVLSPGGRAEHARPPCSHPPPVTGRRCPNSGPRDWPSLHSRSECLSGIRRCPCRLFPSAGLRPECPPRLPSAVPRAAALAALLPGYED